jgi:hypothetical protein
MTPTQPPAGEATQEPTMTPKELAERLNGEKYPLRLPGLAERLSRVVEKAIEAAGLVVVFGASDDLMEFRGAIHDEIGAYEGTIVRVDAKGLLPDYDDIDKDSHNAKDKLRDYFQRENGGKTIEALWSPSDPDCSWAYKTDIPH